MTSFSGLRKEQISTEILAGISSFLATAYIIVVNPSILSQTGMPFPAVLTATILVSFFSSLMMGLYANNPILVAPGMGLNAFFTYTAVLTDGLSWQVALGTVFWSGVFFLILSAFNIRSYIVKAIPKPLRFGIAAGIGLFITLIGFANAKFIVPNPATMKISSARSGARCSSTMASGMRIRSHFMVADSSLRGLVGGVGRCEVRRRAEVAAERQMQVHAAA